MTAQDTSYRELVPHLFRTEYSKMTAVLCRHFGLKHIETAEDIASETFLKASENWAVHGVPENPVGWLYTVAKNKTKDLLKRHKIFETKIKGTIREESLPLQTEQDINFSRQWISDSQLAMIFAVCNPANPAESQICLALQVLCGFSVEEIADAFLTQRETVKKRLYRARKTLRNDNFQIGILTKTAVRARLHTVLRTLYLLFNEGYYSKSGDHLIRKDLCSEAIRLTLMLTENPLTNSGEASALLALMCFQSSRLDARMNDAGEAVLFDEQDKNLWNRELMEKGSHYLVDAFSGNEVSKYHLEAGIAWWHTTTPAGEEKEKWKHILELYNQLILIEYSPATVLNRIFAYAKVYGKKRGIREAEKSELQGLDHYHSLLGYLYTDIDPDLALMHYTKALGLTKSASEKKVLTERVEQLADKKSAV